MHLIKHRILSHLTVHHAEALSFVMMQLGKGGTHNDMQHMVDVCVFCSVTMTSRPSIFDHQHCSAYHIPEATGLAV